MSDLAEYYTYDPTMDTSDFAVGADTFLIASVCRTGFEPQTNRTASNPGWQACHSCARALAWTGATAPSQHCRLCAGEHADYRRATCDALRTRVLPDRREA